MCSDAPPSDAALALLRRQVHGWAAFEPNEREAAEELVRKGLAHWGDWTGEDTHHIEITNRARELL